MKKTMAMILFVILILASLCSKNEQYSTNKSDFREGQGVDVNSNGKPDFIVRNGRFIGTVSGKDFGPATVGNFAAHRNTQPASIKPLTAPAAASTGNYNTNQYYINTNNKTDVENYLHGLGF
ncbi:hypothetical protein FACS189442_4730 [Spirochaetia bacterium]|nr:hypothetical protein FACS189442_4730 [Spirochaetia bacterium]